MAELTHSLNGTGSSISYLLMADRGWKIGEKHEKWSFNFLHEVKLITTVGFIMKIRNVDPSRHKEGQYFFHTLGFHNVISSTLLHIFPVQMAPFIVNKTLI